MKLWFTRCVLIGLFAGLTTLVAQVAAGEKMVVGRAVPKAQQVSMDRIDHSAWTALLNKYVNESGEVNYAAWKASVQDTRLLDAYLNSLSRASRTIAASRPSQLAFWINAYNALTFADPENFQYRGQRRQFQLSSILSWYGEDFGKDQASQLKTIAPYLPTEEAYQAAVKNSVSVTYLKYDWSLNEQNKRPQVGTRRRGPRR